MDLDAHLQMLAGLGAAALIAAWLPSLSSRLRVSGTVVMLLVGFAVYAVGVPLSWPDPFWPDAWTLMFTEAVVIVSLMSAGLKIGRAYALGHWRVPVRLLVVTMPLCIAAGVGLGHYLVGLPIETAVLLGAVLAPTDPVMASEVQVDPDEMEGGGAFDPVRFALTGEASLNDGLAFPFTWLAVLLARAGGEWAGVDWAAWALDKLALKVVVGVALGWGLGRGVGWLLERLPEALGLRTRDGFVAFAATFLTYGATELLHGYGFLAVFVAGLTIRHVEESYAGDALKLRLHDFVAEVERLLLALFLVLFGGAIVNGLVSGLGWRVWGFAALFIFGVRPLAGMLGLVGSDLPTPKRFAVAFLGIRGIGSLFYLSWAFVQADFPARALVYQTLAAVILLSLLAHGLMARTLLAWAHPEGEHEPEYDVEGELNRERANRTPA